MQRGSRSGVLDDLRARLRQLEGAQRSEREAVRPTGTDLDRLLPGRGLTPGTLLEWLSDGEGSGAAALALAIAGQLLQAGGALVVIDERREFYPPAAAGLGIPLERTVVVRPNGPAEALWALDQALRCRAVAIAFGWLEAVNDRAFRRLQLAAEAGGGLGFLLRPSAYRAEPSWAETRLLVKPLPTLSPTSGRRLQVELLHCRGGAGGGVVELELSHEADLVRLVSPVAHPTLPPRATGA